jgi:hypothetical protein
LHRLSEGRYISWSESEGGDVTKKTNNLNFLINLLDKDFFACYKLKSFNAKEVGDLHIMSFLLKTILKEKKEDGMKKLVIVALALFLALPVLSHAGSATSRWDLTIGGYVYMQAGWVDQDVGSGYKNAQRRTGVRENQRNENGNMFAHAEFRPNFIIRGPDAWGAKTWARAEFDFAGQAGEPFGQAVLRHAYMQFDWANDSILIGNTSYGWMDLGVGPPPGFSTLAALPSAFPPSRAPQIRYTHRFGKSISTSFGVEYPGEGTWMSINNDTTNEYTRSKWPNFYGVFKYMSDVCGTIGPNKLTFAMSGVYGRKSMLRTTANTARGTLYDLKQEDGWAAQANLQIPIIPERNQNKAGALLWWGKVQAGQGLSRYNPQTFAATFNPSIYAAVPGFQDDLSTPKGYAVETGFMVYVHDQVYFTGAYNDQKAQVSNRWRSTAANFDSVVRTQMYNFGLMYTPNPAVTLGVEYTRVISGYAAPGYLAGAGNTYAFKKHGTVNALRFGAYYFF